MTGGMPGTVATAGVAAGALTAGADAAPLTRVTTNSAATAAAVRPAPQALTMIFLLPKVDSNFNARVPAHESLPPMIPRSAARRSVPAQRWRGAGRHTRPR